MALCSASTWKLVHYTSAVYIVLLVSSVRCLHDYLETYPPVIPQQNDSQKTVPLYFGLIMSFPGGEFDSSGAIAGVKVALDRINSDPTVLANYTLHYTLTNSSVSWNNNC